MSTDDKSLDAWFKFETPADTEPLYEANTFWDDRGYRIEWYHSDVGLVTELYFATYEDAEKWYAANGFEDYSS